jgi:uncharacterized protein DUF4260
MFWRNEILRLDVGFGEVNNLTPRDGAHTGAVRAWLSAEGLCVAALSVLLYLHLGSSWWMFAGLLLAPDLAILPYLLNPRIGSVSYNVVHSYLLPLGLVTVAIAAHRGGMLPILLIWTAHIGLDRFLGYGLKYPTAFSDTHLGALRNRPERLAADARQ